MSDDDDEVFKQFSKLIDEAISYGPEISNYMRLQTRSPMVAILAMMCSISVIYHMHKLENANCDIDLLTKLFRRIMVAGVET